MNTNADLEIAIRRGTNDDGEIRSYTVEMRFSAPDSDTEDRLIGAGDGSLRLNPNLFNQAITTPAKYGQNLSAAFFQEPKIKAAWDMALNRTPANALLRVRLYIEPQAVELQRLHWEVMADPDPSRVLPLFSSPRIAFSRYLNSGDFRPVRSRQNAERLKALIVISNPSDLASRGFAPILPENELPAVVGALAGAVDYVALATPASATLGNIIAELAKGVDILYMVCHGQASSTPSANWESYLFLEKTDGTAQRVNGAEFVQLVQDLPERPRLIVLASCQSAGDGMACDPEAASFAGAIGPRFAQAGIPAVLAMSGNLTMQTGNVFLPAFFHELLSRENAGQIDRAVSVARFAVKDRPDCWMPSLFMRLRSGKVWYIAGFSDDSNVPWESICKYVTKGDFVPIVGPDLPALVEGSARDHAATLAARKNFPLAAWQTADLSKVAQFVMTRDSVDSTRIDVRDTRMAVVRKNFPELAAKFKGEDHERELLEAAMAQLFEDPDHPYRVLTSTLGPAVYLTTTPDSLLEIALKQAKRTPVNYPCQWRDERQDANDTTIASKDKPAIFYVYGKSDEDDEDTWVLTEDEVFDYLIRTSRHQLWPGFVWNAMAGGTLFFIGFPVDDWKFRVLVRIIMQWEGKELLKVKKKSHICVQVDPDESSIADAIRARKYFEKCFPAEPRIDIYWGTAREFLRDLNRQLTVYRANNPDS